MTNIDELYQKFLEQTCSREEAELLLAYFQKEENAEHIVLLIEQSLEKRNTDSISKEDEIFIAQQKVKFRELLTPPVRIAFLKSAWIKAVACLTLVSLIGLLYHYTQQATDVSKQNWPTTADVAPGGNKAVITLSTGERIELDSLQSTLAMRDGQFYYEGGETIIDASASPYVTVSTPVGGEYQLILSDGTKVWLNAASSIRYPIHFDKQQRRVEVEGEAYLEVVPLKGTAFFVSNREQEIEVLGTAFNVRNYEGVNVTTLVHGSIALQDKKTKERVLLKPNEQSHLNQSVLKLSKVEASDYVSWTTGVILHKDASLRDICQELARWYGVHFVFSDSVQHKGRAIISINRKEALSAVLLALADTYLVDFDIKGKEVLVR